MSLLNKFQFPENITSSLYLEDKDRLIIGFASGLIKVIHDVTESPRDEDFTELHYDSIRTLYRHGDVIISASKDEFVLKLNLDLEILEEYSSPNSTPINTIAYFEPLDMFISGDDEGGLEIFKLGEILEKRFSFKDSADYISKIIPVENSIYVSSGDGTVYKYHFKPDSQEFTKNPSMSPTRDEDCVDMIIDRGGSRIIVAAGESLVFFKHKIDHFDLYLVDFTLEKIAFMDSNLILAACGDGMARLIQIFPRKVFGTAVMHSINDTSVAFMELHEHILITMSFDGLVKVWDISSIRDVLNEDAKPSPAKTNEKTVAKPAPVIDIEGDDEADSDFDYLNLTDADENGISRRTENKMRKLKGANRKLAQSGLTGVTKVDKKKASKAEFFNDL